mgnify:FL=1|tara:strand:+ start:165 stop:509 length:345 start_codon:yes stop_codon:yes gene_type:complete
MSKAKGLHTFTVQEAQNATMGQASTVWADDTDAFTPRVNSGLVIVAIQVMEDCVFSLLTPEDSDNHVGAGAAEITTHNLGQSLAGVTILAGTTFYGRWTAATMSTAGKCFYYLG